MKKSILHSVLTLLFLGIIFGCKDENEFLDQEKMKSNFLDQEKAEIATLRALSYEKPSTSNPNLHNNWETVTKIVLNGGLQVDPPWKVVAGNSIGIPQEFRTDIKRADGWTLLSHTMLEANSAEPNYILFYNKRRGILKGFYFNPFNFPNNSLVWVMESKTPTSIIPTNKRIQGLFNSTYSYATTSNVLKETNFNFGHLNYGWNAFSFELSYGSQNNNPIVDISAHNRQQSLVAMHGKYSGEIVVPEVKKSDETGGFDKIMKSVGGVLVSVGGPKLKTIGTAISAAGSVLGSASAYFTNSDVVYTSARTSGDIELNGNIYSELGGSVSIFPNLPLKSMNGNKDIGLWGLNSIPEFNFYKYQVLQRLPSGDMYKGSPSILSESNKIFNSIIVNPEVANEIKSKKVVDYQFFITKSNYCRYDEKLTDDCYLTKFEYDKSGRYYEHNSKNVYIDPLFQIYGKVYVTLTVEFEYHNGEKFRSCKNFEAKLNRIDNPELVDQFKQAGLNVLLIPDY